MRTDQHFLIPADVQNGASGISFGVLSPQGGDSIVTLLAKILQNGGAGGGSGSSGTGTYVPSPANALYTATAPIYSVATGSGSTPANLTSFSVYNAGPGTGTFNSVNLLPNVSISFDASPGTKFSSVSYNASGTQFFIAGSQLV